MEQRKYQEDQIESGVSEVSTKRKIVIQLPTGAGKTVEFALLAQRYIRNTGKSVLILVHREELMYQARKTVREICDIEPYLITSTTKRYYVSRVYIGMVESTVSRLNMFSNVGMVIVDECHIANFNKIHNLFLEELIIGFSATPISSSKREPINKYYHSIVTGPQIKQLIEDGYLSQNITRCPKHIVDSTKFEIDKLKGDYNERQMATEYKLPKHVTNVIQSYHKFAYNKKCLVFNVNIEHSKEVNECFVTCGYNSRHLDSNCSSEERKEILHWFKITPNAILNNVMITTVGFDEPTVQNIFLNFSTLSLTKFIQCSGRGSRAIDEEWLSKFQCDYPYPIDPKSYFNIIDMGGNCIRFGDWNDDRDWKYMFENPQRPGEGVAPVKTCPECEGLVHAAATVCTLQRPDGELCLYEFEKRKRSEEKSSEMVLVTKGINIDELINKNRKKYEYYTFFELAVPVVNQMLSVSDNPSEKTKAKYFKVYYQLCIEWYDRTLASNPDNMETIANSGWHIRRALNHFNSLIKARTDELVFQPMYQFNELIKAV